MIAPPAPAPGRPARTAVELARGDVALGQRGEVGVGVRARGGGAPVVRDALHGPQRREPRGVAADVAAAISAAELHGAEAAGAGVVEEHLADEDLVRAFAHRDLKSLHGLFSGNNGAYKGDGRCIREQMRRM